jgi:hypothetical protein
MLPLIPGGEFAHGLASGRRAALELDRRLRGDERFASLAAGQPELDIVVWALNAETPEKASERAQQIFDRAAACDLHLALVQLSRSWFETSAKPEGASGAITCLRSVLMKPEHETWLSRIWERLSEATQE